MFDSWLSYEDPIGFLRFHTRIYKEFKHGQNGIIFDPCMNLKKLQSGILRLCQVIGKQLFIFKFFLITINSSLYLEKLYNCDTFTFKKSTRLNGDQY